MFCKGGLVMRPTDTPRGFRAHMPGFAGLALAVPASLVIWAFAITAALLSQ